MTRCEPGKRAIMAPSRNKRPLAPPAHKKAGEPFSRKTPKQGEKPTKLAGKPTMWSFERKMFQIYSIQKAFFFYFFFLRSFNFKMDFFVTWSHGHMFSSSLNVKRSHCLFKSRFTSCYRPTIVTCDEMSNLRTALKKADCPHIFL